MLFPDPRQAEVHARARIARLRNEADVERLVSSERRSEPGRWRRARPFLVALDVVTTLVRYWWLR